MCANFSLMYLDGWVSVVGADRREVMGRTAGSMARLAWARMFLCCFSLRGGERGAIAVLRLGVSSAVSGMVWPPIPPGRNGHRLPGSVREEAASYEEKVRPTVAFRLVGSRNDMSCHVQPPGLSETTPDLLAD